jgi:hypothetical protein
MTYTRVVSVIFIKRSYLCSIILMFLLDRCAGGDGEGDEARQH